MSISRRQIFENLTLACGRELAALFGLEGLSGLSKDALVDVLSGKADALETQLAESRANTKNLLEVLIADLTATKN